MSMLEPILVLEALLKAVSRIPEEYKDHSFFGANDLWLFEARGNPTVRCKLCDHHNGNIFPGTNLRVEWPFLRILDVNTIGGQDANGDGLVHPNCRCRIVRVSPEELAVFLKNILQIDGGIIEQWLS